MTYLVGKIGLRAADPTDPRVGVRKSITLRSLQVFADRTEPITPQDPPAGHCERLLGRSERRCLPRERRGRCALQ
jgi:hypothetical protein